MTRPDPPRVLILANHEKALVTQALAELRPWLQQRARIVAEPDIKTLTPQSAAALPQVDFAIVLGGDGTVLAQARQLVDRDIPMLGVNFGKLGFLAEFSVQSLQAHWESIVSGQCRTTQRMMLAVAVFAPDAPACGTTDGQTHPPVFESLALNDAVITAGPPYRMIELELTIDPTAPGTTAGTLMSADGVIIATPSGSTAYNLSAGGPIVSPGVDAFCITPLCPHSLAMRPLIVKATYQVCVRVCRANEGTTLMIDGQVFTPICAGQQLLVRRHPRLLTILHSPELSYWKMLANKMGWAARPRSQ